MLRFWVREVLGWLLVAFGLYIFLVLMANLLAPPPTEPRILEAPIVGFFGVIVFRGGIHLLKVAVAARVCMQTQAEVRKEPAEPRLPKKDVPWDW